MAEHPTPPEGEAAPSIAARARPLVMGRLASMALTFVLPLGLARLLDPAAFGSYKQLFLVAQTVLLVGQVGLTQSLFFFLPRREPGRGAYLAQALVCLTVPALLSGIGLAVGLPSLAPHLGGGAALSELSLPAGLLCAGLLLAAPLEGALTSERRVGLSALIYVLSDGSRAALLLGGARFGGLLGLAWGAAAWASLRVLVLCGLLASGVLPLARPRRGALAQQLAWALPVALAAWLAVAQRQLSQYAVAARFDAASFALFSVAAFHLPVVDIVYTPVGEVLMVELSRAGTDRAARRRAFSDAVLRLAEVLWPATACALLFGPAVLTLLFGARYAAAGPLFLLTSLEIPFWVLPVDTLLRAAGRTRFLFAWYAARVPLSALLVLGGMRAAGLGGAIVGAVLSEASSRGVMRWAAGRDLGPAPATRDGDGGGDGRSGLLRTALGATLPMVPAWAVMQLVPAQPLAGGIATYGAGWLALRVLWWWRGGRRAATCGSSCG